MWVRSSFVASVLLRVGKNASLVFGGMVGCAERGYSMVKTPKK